MSILDSKPTKNKSIFALPQVLIADEEFFLARVFNLKTEKPIFAQIGNESIGSGVADCSGGDLRGVEVKDSRVEVVGVGDVNELRDGHAFVFLLRSVGINGERLHGLANLPLYFHDIRKDVAIFFLQIYAFQFGQSQHLLKSLIFLPKLSDDLINRTFIDDGLILDLFGLVSVAQCRQGLFVIIVGR